MWCFLFSYSNSYNLAFTEERNQGPRIARAFDLTGMNVTNYVGKFGASEFMSATVNLDATEHFIGSYRIDIYQIIKSMGCAAEPGR